MSSSRDQVSFTGPPIALEISTASPTKSSPPRRPNPPPRKSVWIFTFWAGSPVILTAVPCAEVWICVEVQTSQPSARTSAPVHRLHRSVRQVGRFVNGLDLFCGPRQGCFPVAHLACHGARLGGHIHERFSDARAARVGVRPLVELHLERFPSFHGRPCVIGYYGDAI